MQANQISYFDAILLDRAETHRATVPTRARGGAARHHQGTGLFLGNAVGCHANAVGTVARCVSPPRARGPGEGSPRSALGSTARNMPGVMSSGRMAKGWPTSGRDDSPLRTRRKTATGLHGSLRLQA